MPLTDLERQSRSAVAVWLIFGRRGVSLENECRLLVHFAAKPEVGEVIEVDPSCLREISRGVFDDAYWEVKAVGHWLLLNDASMDEGETPLAAFWVRSRNPGPASGGPSILFVKGPEAWLSKSLVCSDRFGFSSL